ncbi:HelD family protein [Streptomyces hoynatensis]|uniref:Helicase n=1 Tax=Streptomyces hoynatensis TaxID=1141874 RepID=A0A3A9YXU9_9ACTN|nr:ATP-binding domain-containing protein [Streptomyces hoynatensis]RKN40474.1 helicase [Streptomyces hoynatensis]
MDEARRSEQHYLTRLYGRLDALRGETQERLDSVLAATGLGHQGLAERDVAAAELARRLNRLESAETGLCFGRLDMRDEERRYIGRIGILDGSAECEPLLIDWRAPAARPFYVATAVSHENVRRRRHIRTRGRQVIGVQDEELEGTAEISGDGALMDALLDALDAARTGRMSDIVATIQAEQDEIIRSPHAGVLVVQGGPGTGKTAVALHRAAYLLYTHRERLARSVVLVIGPSPTFLRYIGDVLPALGETSVLTATVAELFPGVRAVGAEPSATAELKGRPVMAEVIAAAVAARQGPSGEEGFEVPHEGSVLRLGPEECRRLRDTARSWRLPHNEARPLVHELFLDALAHRHAERYGTDVIDGSSLLTEADLETIRAELDGSREVAAALEEFWPLLSPQRLLAELFSSPARLAAAAPGLTPAERALLLRGPHRRWTPADVPLLDEAAELLGSDDSAARAAAAAEREERVRLAQEALDVALGSRGTDIEDDVDPGEAEELSPFDLVDAETLAERHEERDHREQARRAAADRTWAFGHVVVDEAQELSAMAWRLVMRRCPARSLTIVGDIAQTGDPGGAPSWERMLAPHVGRRFRLAELSVNYRLPAEIAEVAAHVLRRIDPARTAPRAVRATGVRPWRCAVPPERLTGAVAECAARECAGQGAGLVGVIAPAARLPELRAAVADAAPAGRVEVLDPRTAKGLEYDAVLVVDPDGIVAESPRGLSDLYVALTRATQRLGVVHSGRPPADLPPLRRVAAEELRAAGPPASGRG